jgi:hypothetical protein
MITPGRPTSCLWLANYPDGALRIRAHGIQRRVYTPATDFIIEKLGGPDDAKSHLRTLGARQQHHQTINLIALLLITEGNIQHDGQLTPWDSWSKSQLEYYSNPLDAYDLTIEAIAVLPIPTRIQHKISNHHYSGGTTSHINLRYPLFCVAHWPEEISHIMYGSYCRTLPDLLRAWGVAGEAMQHQRIG